MPYITNIIHTYPFHLAAAGLFIIAIVWLALRRPSVKIRPAYSPAEVSSVQALLERNPNASLDEIEEHIERLRAEKKRLLPTATTDEGDELIVSSYKVHPDQPRSSFKLQPDEPAVSSIPAVSAVRVASNVSGVRKSVHPDANGNPDASVEKKTALN